MAADLSAVLGRLRERHVLAIRGPGKALRCNGCGDRWPCDASRLLAVAEAAADDSSLAACWDPNPITEEACDLCGPCVLRAALDALAASLPEEGEA